jgi:hypothetical protein
MNDDNHKSSACIVAWDDMALEMMEQNVHPKNGLFWGKPQVVWLKWKCTVTPTAVNGHDFPMEYSMEDERGKWHVQCN